MLHRFLLYLACLLPAAPALADNLNLALGMPTYASSLENNGLPASNATDGDHTTRWSSQFADPQYIYVDLGSTQTIDRVRLTWERAYGKDFTIDVSDDASTWTTLRTITNNNPTASNGLLVNEYERLQGSGRYVRIYGTARATGYGYSLYEFEVFSFSNPSTSLATGKTGTASDVQSNFYASQAFDGDSTTRWSTLNASNQWVYVDLNGIGTISRIYLNWERAWGIAYQVQTSNDASTWTTVASVTNNQAYYNELSLPANTTGRYVRIFGQTGGQNNGGFSLWEVRLFGTLTPLPAAAPLPVQLVSLAAQRQASTVALAWATASELNNKGFEVQRSADGSEFATLGFVAGAGSSASAHRYQYQDAAPLATQAYYRLRQVDSDGSSIYSPTVAVAAEATEPATVSTYPNPATDQTTLSWQASAAHSATWTLRNSLGQAITSGQLQGQAGANTASVPLQACTPGSYVLTLEVAGQPAQRTRVQVSGK